MKILVNKCYGGYNLSKEVCVKLSNLGYKIEIIDKWTNSANELPRHNKDLIKIVEELGLEKSSGECCQLSFEEVNGIYKIEEKDGWEYVHEPTINFDEYHDPFKEDLLKEVFEAGYESKIYELENFCGGVYVSSSSEYTFEEWYKEHKLTIKK